MLDNRLPGELHKGPSRLAETLIPDLLSLSPSFDPPLDAIALTSRGTQPREKQSLETIWIQVNKSSRRVVGEQRRRRISKKLLFEFSNSIFEFFLWEIKSQVVLIFFVDTTFFDIFVVFFGRTSFFRLSETTCLLRMFICQNLFSLLFIHLILYFTFDSIIVYRYLLDYFID